MLKWYADNSELSSKKGKPNVLVFGGVIVDNNSEKQIQNLLREVKEKYTDPNFPVKWNFKDLEIVYTEWDRKADYEHLKHESSEWRREIFERSLEIDYTVVLACTERYQSKKPLQEIKEKLTSITFAQALMRIGLFASDLNSKEHFEIILDWPDSSNPKPFNREYFNAYNIGESCSGVKFYSGRLKSLGFNDSLYFAKSTHSAVLQFTDLIIGAAKDFILQTIRDKKHTLGYNLTRAILGKYRGYPERIINLGMNFAPKNDNYRKLGEEIEKNIF